MGAEPGQEAYGGHGHGGIIALPGRVDAAPRIHADEHGDHGKGKAAGGGDGDEAAMVGGGDDGLGWVQSRGHGTGDGAPLSNRKRPNLLP